MKPLLTRDAARRFDGRIVDAGVPGLLLMENAGRGAAELFLRRFAGRLGRVVVVGGTGQNGGDAWVVARRLLTHGVRPEVFLAGSREKVGGDAKVNLEALDALGLDYVEGGWPGANPTDSDFFAAPPRLARAAFTASSTAWSLAATVSSTERAMT